MEGARVTGDPRDRRRSESGGSTPDWCGGGRGGADLARSGGGGGDEAAARRAGMEGPRVTGDPRDRRGLESGGSTPERWGGRWRSGTRGGGMERIWRGAGEAERGGDEAEPRRSQGGEWRGARVTGARGRPLPLMWPAGSGWRASWASCSRAGPRAESGRTLTVPGRAGPRACGAAQARHDARAGPARARLPPCRAGPCTGPNSRASGRPTAHGPDGKL